MFKPDHLENGALKDLHHTSFKYIYQISGVGGKEANEAKVGMAYCFCWLFMVLEVPTSRRCKPAQVSSNFAFLGAGSSKGLVVPLRKCHRGKTRIQLGFPSFFTIFIRTSNFSVKLEQHRQTL